MFVDYFSLQGLLDKYGRDNAQTPQGWKAEYKDLTPKAVKVEAPAPAAEEAPAPAAEEGVGGGDSGGEEKKKKKKDKKDKKDKKVGR